MGVMESPCLDGCRDLQILFKIIISLLKPTVSRVGILTFILTYCHKIGFNGKVKVGEKSFDVRLNPGEAKIMDMKRWDR